MVSSGDQVAQITIDGASDKSLLSHPDVVVHLRQIFASAITGECHHAFTNSLLSTIMKRGRKQSARRRSAEDSFLAKKFPSRRKAFSVGDRVSFLEPAQIGNLRNKIF